MFFSVSGLLKENTFTQISEILVFCFRKLKVKFDFVRNCFCRWRVICPWLLENLVFFFHFRMTKRERFSKLSEIWIFSISSVSFGCFFLRFPDTYIQDRPNIYCLPPLSRGRHVVFILSCPLVCHRSCEHEFLDTLCWIEIILDPFNYHDVKMCLSFVFFLWDPQINLLHFQCFFVKIIFSLCFSDAVLSCHRSSNEAKLMEECANFLKYAPERAGGLARQKAD